MSVAECLGVDCIDRSELREARRRWPEWTAGEPALAVVSDLVELPSRMCPSSHSAADEVLASLARVARRAPAAVSVITWLLLPGAVVVARRLTDLSPDIDALVAGQLWLVARGYDGTPGDHVAGRLLRATRQAVMAELGVGEAAARRDRTWACTVPVAAVPDREVVPPDRDPEQELGALLDGAVASGCLSPVQRLLLQDVARAADALQAPARRGRSGLATPSVAELVAEDHEASPRTVRRRAGEALAALETYARSGA